MLTSHKIPSSRSVLSPMRSSKGDKDFFHKMIFLLDSNSDYAISNNNYYHNGVMAP